MTQPTLWDQAPEVAKHIRFTGPELRDSGMNQALAHADEADEAWSIKAYHFLLHYLKSHDLFMAEDVRKASTFLVPEPPSTRAWGPIFVKAIKQGKIERAGFKSVENPKAHCTPASLWRAVR